MLRGMAEIRVELLVVGGGLAGMSLASACAGAGIETALVDRATPASVLTPSFDGRTTALAFGSQQVLAGIGLWQGIAPAAEPIREIRVADGQSHLFLHYDHRLLGDHPLGYIVENRVLRHAILEWLALLPNLVHVAPAAVAGVEYSAGGAVAALADGRMVRAALVAAADGAASPLREAAGIKTLTWCHPMTGNRSSIVWTERAALAPGLMALDSAAFLAELARRFGDHLGALAVAGPRWSYPLSFLHAASYAAPRLALIGEAAHVIHPIAGQGLNLGIRDVAALAEAIVDARRLGLDIGSADVLARYEARRRGDAVLLAVVTDGLNRLFSNDIAPLALARDLGLAAVDRIPPLKKLFMRHAMGLAA